MTLRALVFLGYESTLADANVYLASAQELRGDVQWNVWSYPRGAGADAQSALNAFGNDRFDQVISIIRGEPDTKHYVVGHSSGCAIANAVVAGLGDPPAFSARVRLVALDGFRPSELIMADHPDTECWHAWCNGSNVPGIGPFSRGSVRSLNWDYGNEGKPWFKTYRATNCFGEWALHFSLVNKAASDATVIDIAHGYNDCIANLDVLTLPVPVVA